MNQIEAETLLMADVKLMKKIGEAARARVNVERKRARGLRTSQAKATDLWHRAYGLATRLDQAVGDDYVVIREAFYRVYAATLAAARVS